MADLPPPATVYLEPKVRDPLSKPLAFRSFYILSRTALLALEISTLGYTAWLAATYTSRSGVYRCGIVAVALAVALDTTAIGSLFYKRNLSYNLNSFFNVVDVAVFATGLAGWLWIAFADFNMEYAPPIMPYDGPENICAGLLIAIWVAHVLLSCINCFECCCACRHAKDSEKAARRRAQRNVQLVSIRDPTA